MYEWKTIIILAEEARKCEWKEDGKEERRNKWRGWKSTRASNPTVVFCPGQPRAGGSTSHSRQVRITTSALPYIHLRLLHPPTFSRLVHLKRFRPLLLAAGCQSFQVGQSALLWARSRNRSTLILEFCVSWSLTTRFSLDRSTFFSFSPLVML